jgi:hypothetical protein
MKKLFVVLIALNLFLPFLSGQDWIAPESMRKKFSPFRFTDTTKIEGARGYNTNCMSCHGTPGRGNFVNLVPPPPDPVTDRLQKNSDGELFFKISEGRSQMPSFKNVLTAGEIWKIISFLRSFNKSYRQEVMAVMTTSAYPGAEIKIRLAYNPSDTSIMLNAFAFGDKGSVPVAGADVRLFAFRTFGLLPLDEEKTTSANGSAVFRIPSDLRGDREGNVRLVARFTNEELFGGIARDTIIQAGLKTTPVSLVAKRAMWNKGSMSPLWVTITYLTGLLIVWTFIVLIIIKLRDIYIIGRTVSDNNDNLHDLNSEN